MSTELTSLRKSLPLLVPTPDAWAALAIEQTAVFLQDHASCERKAHAGAMMLANKYFDFPELQDRMVSLAIEELRHFQQVMMLLRKRNIPVAPDTPNLYVNAFFPHLRNPRQDHLLDRLLIAAVVEARSCERFCLFAESLPQGDLKDFYTNFAFEEGAHFPLFVDTARLIFPHDAVKERIDFFIEVDAATMPKLPLRPTVH
jgi:tRNA-(ms[2]io[6]A)-hydroxylase